MMKIFFTIAVFFFINNTITSQNIVYGVKGGINISKFNSNSNNPFSQYDGKVGFHVGGLVEIPLSEKFSMQPELLYSLQGTNINSGERVIRLNNLQLPIMAKYYIVKRLGLEAGPVLDYLLSAKLVGDLNSEDGREVKDITDIYKTLNVAIGAGASYTLKTNLFFGLRYNFGFLDISDDTFNEVTLRTRALQVSAGYFF